MLNGVLKRSTKLFLSSSVANSDKNDSSVASCFNHATNISIISDPYTMHTRGANLSFYIVFGHAWFSLTNDCQLAFYDIVEAFASIHVYLLLILINNIMYVIYDVPHMILFYTANSCRSSFLFTSTVFCVAHSFLTFFCSQAHLYFCSSWTWALCVIPTIATKYSNIRTRGIHWRTRYHANASIPHPTHTYTTHNNKLRKSSMREI